MTRPLAGIYSPSVVKVGCDVVGESDATLLQQFAAVPSEQAEYPRPRLFFLAGTL